MARDQKFEIPQELRELAEENVERAPKLRLHLASSHIKGIFVKIARELACLGPGAASRP
jgi:hypothetical protein